VGCRHGPLLAANFVVIRQRPQFNAIGVCAFGQGFWRQSAVRHDGMAMEVGVG
jgi:hypothetical protein